MSTPDTAASILVGLCFAAALYLDWHTTRAINELPTRWTPAHRPEKGGAAKATKKEEPHKV